jgi:hypothetical protein
MNSLRFIAQQASAGGDLRVRAFIQTPDGVQSVLLADLADGSMPAWAPTDPIGGDTSGLSDDDSLMVALRFRVPDAGASWQIDDIYVDPWRSG